MDITYAIKKKDGLDIRFLTIFHFHERMMMCVGEREREQNDVCDRSLVNLPCKFAGSACFCASITLLLSTHLRKLTQCLSSHITDRKMKAFYSLLGLLLAVGVVSRKAPAAPQSPVKPLKGKVIVDNRYSKLNTVDMMIAVSRS